ncbi:ABC transporter ATP-binding protein [Sporolactobacillus sp. THM19-2]|uniref:ABC transporter ATP-binding protein n=1 Tax=Sporolactobacillus sp. THM19-2 TaxID=2511171 RepID=UPI001F0D0E3F|nr:ABC transporter ATP-binding protein [Sporolactobacillus sp. THM19-2]
MNQLTPLLTIKDLKVEFHTNKKIIHAVNGINFQLNKSEVIGIVGESGSGKSVTATSILKLIPSPPGEISGEILYNGHDLVKYKEKDMRKIRGNEISMIFQDPMTSLNPAYTVGNQLVEAIRLHKKISKKDAIRQAVELLQVVGIHEAEKRLNMYPHQFSGGMRQRVMIAIALAGDPSLLIADEPTTALDVTVQSQIMKLMKQLQMKFNASIILITHDLGVVWEMCDKVIVMYAGQAMEEATVKELYDHPYHPYTWGLFDSQIVRKTNTKKPLHAIPGNPPDLSRQMKGCPFAERCSYVKDICFTEKPQLVEKSEGHKVACHFQTKSESLSRKEG